MCAAIGTPLLACSAEQYRPSREGAGKPSVDGPSLGSGGSLAGTGGESFPGNAGTGGGGGLPGDDAGGSGTITGSGGSGGLTGSGGTTGSGGSGGMTGSGGMIGSGGMAGRTDAAAADVGGNDVVGAPAAMRAAVLNGSTGTALGGNANGGSPFQDGCPAGQVVIGFSGTATVATGTMGVVPRQIATRCGVIQISGTTVSITPGAMLPIHGMMAAMPWTRTCPANQVIVGFTGRSGSFMDQLVFDCAPLVAASAAAGANLTPGTATPLPPIGGTGGMAFAQIDCAVGEVASGSLVRTGDFMDAVSLICSKATIAR